MNSKNHSSTTSACHGFSMVEMLSIVGLVGILALIGIISINKIRPAAEATKLRSDVQSLNSAIAVYQHSGGNIPTTGSAYDIVAKLKTIRQTETAEAFVGLTGSMVDSRLSLVEMPTNYEGPRAIYDASEKKFVITRASVPGYHFELSDNSNQPAQQEERDGSTLNFAKDDGWVWEYEDAVAPAPLVPTSVTKVALPAPQGDTPLDVSPPTGPEAPVLQKLLPPDFSISTGVYDLDEYSLTLTLTNPNGSNRGKIVFAVITDSDWEWLDYASPIPVSPADKIIAFIQSSKPQEFHHSDPRDEFYDWVTQLSDPSIEAVPNDIDARTGSTTITITSPNDPDFYSYNGDRLAIPAGSFKTQYKLVPLEFGEGVETEWADYNEPFDIGGPQFPRGFDVVARVVGNGPNFVDSSEVRSTVTTFYTLDPPQISSSTSVITDPTETVTITIDNPNPIGSSTIEYQILDDLGTVVADNIPYNGPFPLNATDFPEGFEIVATSVPSDPFYRESDPSNAPIDAEFFGIPVSGMTIFVLDTSNSMRSENRINRLKAAADGILSTFDENDQFAVVNYDQNAATTVSWGNATAEKVTSARAAVNAMTLDLGTNYHAALQQALNLNATGANQVVFLSDGRPFRIDRTPRQDTTGILELVDQFVALGIRFDTVALGESRDILSDMAARGNGQAIVIPD